MNLSEKTLELTNPPVVEAVIDISVKPNPESDINLFASQDVEFIKKFPTHKPIHRFEGKFDLSAETESQLSHTKTMIGFSYRSEELGVLIQRRINGFSYHKLGKYCGWPQFIPPAMQYWSDYKKSQKNLEVQRLGLRFVNLIDIEGDPENFFRVLLSNTKSLGKLSNLGYQYSLELSDEYSATVILRPIDKDGKKYVLDIDVFKQNISTGITEKEIENHFEKMREAKNILFSSTLTKKALKRYE